MCVIQNSMDDKFHKSIIDHRVKDLMDEKVGRSAFRFA